MGAVYIRTSTGARLRADDATHRAELITALFEPYSQALADLVEARLAATNHAMILDLHSFPKEALPYELYPNEERPVICIGADDRHTPTTLLEAARDLFAPLGTVGVNQPFRGTYVPLRHYGRDDRVRSIMLESRRDAYLHPDGTPDNAAINRFAAAGSRLIDESIPV